MRTTRDTSKEIVASECKCIVYHPPVGGTHWIQLVREFKQTGNILIGYQVWGKCEARDEEQLQPGEHMWGPQLTGQVKEYDKKVLQEEE
jgi:hypothetical protein